MCAHVCVRWGRASVSCPTLLRVQEIERRDPNWTMLVLYHPDVSKQRREGWHRRAMRADRCARTHLVTAQDAVHARGQLHLHVLHAGGSHACVHAAVKVAARHSLARSSAQAVLFNAAQLPDIIAELEAKVGCQGDDDIIKQYARLMGSRFRAYVHVPSLFQHVGSISTLTNNGTTHNFHWSTDFVP